MYIDQFTKIIVIDVYRSICNNNDIYFTYDDIERKKLTDQR